MGPRPDLGPNASDPKSQTFPACHSHTHTWHTEQCHKEEICVSFKTVTFAMAGTLWTGGSRQCQCLIFQLIQLGLFRPPRNTARPLRAPLQGQCVRHRHWNQHQPHRHTRWIWGDCTFANMLIGPWSPCCQLSWLDHELRGIEDDADCSGSTQLQKTTLPWNYHKPCILLREYCDNRQLCISDDFFNLKERYPENTMMFNTKEAMPEDN